MHKSLQNTWNWLERERKDIGHLLSKYEEVWLNEQPSPGKWSVLQIVYHLKTAEKLSAQYIQKKALAADQLKPNGLTAGPRVSLMKMMLRSPVKFKAPAATTEIPDQLDKIVVLREWHEDRKELEEYLAQLPDGMLKKALYKHPVAGRMNVAQMLDFFKEHFNHHLPQIVKILRS